MGGSRLLVGLLIMTYGYGAEADRLAIELAPAGDRDEYRWPAAAGWKAGTQSGLQAGRGERDKTEETQPARRIVTRRTVICRISRGRHGG